MNRAGSQSAPLRDLHSIDFDCETALVCDESQLDDPLRLGHSLLIATVQSADDTEAYPHVFALLTTASLARHAPRQ